MLRKPSIRTEEEKADVDLQLTAHSEYLHWLEDRPAPAFQRSVSCVIWRAHMMKKRKRVEEGCTKCINETRLHTLNKKPGGSLAVVSIQGLLKGIKKACLLWIPFHDLFTLGGGWAHMLLLSKCLCRGLLCASDYLTWHFSRNSSWDRYARTMSRSCKSYHELVQIFFSFSLDVPACASPVRIMVCSHSGLLSIPTASDKGS